MSDEPVSNGPRKKKRIRALSTEEFAFALSLHRDRLEMTPEEVASFLWGMPVKTYEELEAGTGPELPPWVMRGVLKTLGGMRPTAG